MLVREVMRRYPNGIPFLDPIEDMQIDDPEFKKLLRRIETLEDRLLTRPEFKREDILDLCAEFEKKKLDKSPRWMAVLGCFSSHQSLPLLEQNNVA